MIHKTVPGRADQNKLVVGASKTDSARRKFNGAPIFQATSPADFWRGQDVPARRYKNTLLAHHQSQAARLALIRARPARVGPFRFGGAPSETLLALGR